MLAAAGPRAPIMGIGVLPGPDGPVDYEIGWPEFERDQAWADRVLERWGISAGDRILLVLANHEYAWAGSLIAAIRARRAVYSPVEPYGWDVRRLSTFLRSHDIRAVIGLPRETVEAVAGSETVERLAAVPRLIVRADAVEPLRAEGVTAAAVLGVGPALGIECPERTGVHLDPAEWDLAVEGGTVRLSSRGTRAHTFDGFDTGLPGELVDEPCACGLPGTRIALHQS